MTGCGLLGLADFAANPHKTIGILNRAFQGVAELTHTENRHIAAGFRALGIGRRACERTAGGSEPRAGTGSGVRAHVADDAVGARGVGASAGVAPRVAGLVPAVGGGARVGEAARGPVGGRARGGAAADHHCHEGHAVGGPQVVSRSGSPCYNSYYDCYSTDQVTYYPLL